MASTNKCTLCENITDSLVIKVRSIFICEECIASMHNTMNSLHENEDLNLKKKKIMKILKPSEINKILNEYVIDQEIAKDKLATAIYTHQKMIAYQERHGDNCPIDIEKSNIIMVGPTGSGKTFMLKTLAKKLGIPLAIEDATILTAAGYVGEDVENCLRKLIENADYDIERAQKGIIFIDEIDKVGRKGENVSISRDVSGEGVQQALFKIVEGTIAEVPAKGGRKHPTQETIKIDTSNILFIVGGSFEGIEKIIAKRKQGKSTMGFNAKVSDSSKIDFNDAIHDITTADLMKFGMLPEFYRKISYHSYIK